MKPMPFLFALSLTALAAPSASAQEAPEKDPPRVLVVERTIDAPIERVWAAFTDPAAITAWMAPHAQVDLRVGGAIRTNYDAKGEIGDPNTIVNEVLSFEPLRMLSLRNVKAPVDFPFAEGTVGTWSVSYFTPLEDGRTHVRLVGLGWPKGEAGDKAYAFFERANAYSLQLLAKHLAGEQVTKPKTDGSDVPEDD